MSAPDVFQNLYAYNKWANDRVLAAAALADPSALQVDLGAGQGTALQTLGHLLRAQVGWLRFWRGEEQLSRQDGVDPSLVDLTQAFARSHADLQHFLDAFEPAAVDIELTDVGGGLTSRWKQWHLLFHVVNHGTQHRAEVGQALMRAGSSPGDLDYGFFCDERRSSDAGSLEMMRALYEYTFWADDRLLAAMDGMTDDELLAPRGGDFSIGMCLLHALGAQRGWLRIWSRYELDVALPGAGAGGHLDKIRDGFRRMHAAIAEFIGELTDDKLVETRELRPDQYNDWTRNERRLWDAMIHVVNHTTQHRAEAAMALTAVGRSPGDLELDDLTVIRTRTSASVHVPGA